LQRITLAEHAVDAHNKRIQVSGMKKISLRRRSVIVLAAVTAGVIGAGGGTAFAITQDGSSPAPQYLRAAQGDTMISAAPEEKTDWPTNESGQTYGSSRLARSFSDRPDLIAAISQDGTHGYVRRDELDKADGAPGIAFKSPEDGVAWRNNRAAQIAAGQVIAVPLYAQDGKTVIGSFRVG
jgi:hypothetical protein